jgi:hypothetical protein
MPAVVSNEIIHALNEKRKVRVEAYSVSDKIEARIREVLSSCLIGTGCEEIHGPLYTVIKELLINAVKANYKNIYFENYNPNKSISQLNYATALQLFKLEMSRDQAVHFEQKARAQDIRADVVFARTDGHLHVHVANPATMTDIEYTNVQKKLSYARKCQDISEYFMDEDEDPHKEGAGLGLILIIMVLRSLGVSESDFLIQSSVSGTVASFSVPLDVKTIESFKVAAGR